MTAYGRTLAATLVFVAMLAVPASAHADPALRLSVDWGKVLHDGAAWAYANMERGDRAGSVHEMQATPEASRAASPSELGTAVFGAEPHVSIVARDWGDARRLTGRLSLTDQMRLSRSSRMVVGRVRLGDGLIVPFAQFGLGQWRIDTDVMPGWTRDLEAAVQFGGGFEVRIWHNYALALESDYTVLYREQHEPQNFMSPRFWGTFAASRLQF